MEIKRWFLLLALCYQAHSAWSLTLGNLRDQSRSLAIDNGTRLRFSTGTIDTFLNEAQRIAVLDAKPIIKSAQFELTVGATYYGLPADFLQIRRLTLKYLDLSEQTPESLSNKVGLSWETVGALPTNYYIVFSSRTNVAFYPWPNSSSSTGTVRYEYYAQSTDLSATTDVPFNGITELLPYNYILAYYAAYKMAIIDGRTDLAVLYRTEFYEGLERMKREALNRPSYRPSATTIDRSNRIGPN